MMASRYGNAKVQFFVKERVLVLNLWNSSRQAMVGVDISSSAIKIMQLSCSDGSYSIENYAKLWLPEQSIDQYHLQKNKIISHLSSQTNIHKFKGKYAVLAIPDSLAFKKNITVTTKLSNYDIKKFVHMEVKKYFSGSVMVDFCLTNPTPESTTVSVQIIVLRANHVLERIKLLRTLGLHTKIVEVESFAIERTARILLSYTENQTFAILDLNSTHQRFFVFAQNKLIFMHEDLVDEADKTASKYCLLNQLKKRLHHFLISYPHYIIQKIWLMGSLVFADEAIYKVQYELNINIQYLYALQHTEQNMLQADFPLWVTAYGLALRGSGYE